MNFPKFPLIYTCLILILFMFMHTSCRHKRQDSDYNKYKNQAITVQAGQQDDTAWWKKEADHMVNSQLIARGIKDKNVIRVMKNTPRHLFVPKSVVNQAYDDRPLPIGEGQTISQPYIVAIMTELLALKGHEKVLEIGTGSGYQAAVLAQLADTCYTIELVKNLADSAATRLKLLGYHNVVAKCGNGYQGWAEHAPFDCIIITAAPEKIPEKLVQQLKIGGRMVVPVGDYNQDLMFIIRTKKGLKTKNIIPVRFVPMVKPK